MPPTVRWEPRFEFYFSEHDGCPFSSFIDLEARKHAPLASHPVALRARLQMRDPRPDGLRSAAEAPALFEFEDSLVARLAEALDSIYVGRRVGDGRTELLLYVPPSTDAEPAAIAADLEPYDVSFTRVLDRSWAHYAELYPDARQWRQIMDRRVLEALQERGDQPEVPREVDHMVYFDERTAAETAARALTERGFEFFDEPVKEREGKFALAFHRKETCAFPDVQRFVSEILDVVIPLGGNYDGWGCEVQAAPAGSPDGGK
jgi:regulator of RNase E activity RraB